MIVFRGVVTEGLGDLNGRNGVFERKVREWNSIAGRVENEWKCLEKGLGWK